MRCVLPQLSKAERSLKVKYYNLILHLLFLLQHTHVRCVATGLLTTHLMTLRAGLLFRSPKSACSAVAFCLNQLYREICQKEGVLSNPSSEL